MAYNRYNKKPAVVKAPRAIRNWSQHQMNLFDAVRRGETNIHVDALAGSGKTTSTVECIYHIDPSYSLLFCAFARDIMEELSSRVPDGKDVLTFHGLGYRASRKAFPRIGKPDKEKLNGYIRAEMGDDPDTYEERDLLKQVISLSKGYLAHNYQDIDLVIDRHGIDVNGERDSFIEKAIRIMEATKRDTNRIDFDDMVWFPLVHNLPLTKYDKVLIDEAQDLNPAQIELGLASCHRDGRIVSVGDEHQAIYAFRGADSNAIQNIVARMNSTRLPLSVTYRCARKIVALAQEFVPELQAAESAEDGKVENVSSLAIEEMAQPGDFILSRTNAPLIRICLNLLRSNIPANIQGRDVGDGFIALIKRSRKSDVTSFLSWLKEWEEVEVQRLVSLKRDSSIVQDKVECLETLCRSSIHNSTSTLIKDIKALFHDGKPTDRVMLSTTHKAKGLERDRVFLLQNTYKPGKNQEENNLYYVGITRAKRELYLVS